MAGPDSTPDFKGGRYRGLIVAGVVVVLAIVAVLVLSGVFKKPSRAADPNPDNKEGCPCNCDRSTAMVAELRALGGEGALREIDTSLATIREREAKGYITEAMIAHRLRLLGAETEMRKSGLIPVAAHPRLAPFENVEPRALPSRVVDEGKLGVGLELVVHAQMTEWVKDREKLQRACFLLVMELENATDGERVVEKPSIEANAAFPISRWYVRGENGEPWDGHLRPREKKAVHVIGYAGQALEPKTKIDATIQFESATFHATTRARSHWDQIEPTYASL